MKHLILVKGRPWKGEGQVIKWTQAGREMVRDEGQAPLLCVREGNFVEIEVK